MKKNYIQVVIPPSATSGLPGVGQECDRMPCFKNLKALLKKLLNELLAQQMRDKKKNTLPALWKRGTAGGTDAAPTHGAGAAAGAVAAATPVAPLGQGVGIDSVVWGSLDQPLSNTPNKFAYVKQNTTHKFILNALSGKTPTAGVRFAKCSQLADLFMVLDMVLDRAFTPDKVQIGHQDTGQFPIDTRRAVTQVRGWQELPETVQAQLLVDIRGKFMHEAIVSGRITTEFWNNNGYANYPGYHPAGRDHQSVSNGCARNITHHHHRAAVLAAQEKAEAEAQEKAAQAVADLELGQSLFQEYVNAGGVDNIKSKKKKRMKDLAKVLRFLEYEKNTGEKIPSTISATKALVDERVMRAVLARAAAAET
jgi:hypothetical protein